MHEIPKPGQVLVGKEAPGLDWYVTPTQFDAYYQQYEAAIKKYFKTRLTSGVDKVLGDFMLPRHNHPERLTHHYIEAAAQIPRHLFVFENRVRLTYVDVTQIYDPDRVVPIDDDMPLDHERVLNAMYEFRKKPDKVAIDVSHLPPRIIQVLKDAQFHRHKATSSETSLQIAELILGFSKINYNNIQNRKKPFPRFLELGSGGGYLLSVVAEEAAMRGRPIEVVGKEVRSDLVDMSKVAMQKARDQGYLSQTALDHISVHKEDGSLEIPGRFDVIVVSFLVEYLEVIDHLTSHLNNWGKLIVPVRYPVSTRKDNNIDNLVLFNSHMQHLKQGVYLTMIQKEYRTNSITPLLEVNYVDMWNRSQSSSTSST